MADSVTGLVGEVRNQRERLETVINSIDDGIVVLDAQRHVIAANDSFLVRARHSREDVLGCQCRELTPGGCTVADCPTLACLGSGARQVRICERRTPEGKVVWEEVHASPILDSSGHLQQVVEVWRDISERRAAEAHLAESHRLASVGTLASGFSHELNTPLATVLTCVEGILRKRRRYRRRHRAHRGKRRLAREQLMRCRGITQHFLRLSRGQRSQGEMVDLRSRDRRGRAPDRAYRSGTYGEDRGPADAADVLVRADDAELQHVLINLMLNAVQASSQSGGRVTVEAEAGEKVRVRVIDNGCGIAPENQKRIFEPFFSLRKGGTGLGLFLSLNFVRRWGGDTPRREHAGRRIDVRSRAAGHGWRGNRRGQREDRLRSCSSMMIDAFRRVLGGRAARRGYEVDRRSVTRRVARLERRSRRSCCSIAAAGHERPGCAEGDPRAAARRST